LGLRVKIPGLVVTPQVAEQCCSKEFLKAGKAYSEIFERVKGQPPSLLRNETLVSLKRGVAALMQEKFETEVALYPPEESLATRRALRLAEYQNLMKSLSGEPEAQRRMKLFPHAKELKQMCCEDNVRPAIRQYWLRTMIICERVGCGPRALQGSAASDRNLIAFGLQVMHSIASLALAVVEKISLDDDSNLRTSANMTRRQTEDMINRSLASSLDLGQVQDWLRDTWMRSERTNNFAVPPLNALNEIANSGKDRVPASQRTRENMLLMADKVAAAGRAHREHADAFVVAAYAELQVPVSPAVQEQIRSVHHRLAAYAFLFEKYAELGRIYAQRFARSTSVPEARPLALDQPVQPAVREAAPVQPQKDIPVQKAAPEKGPAAPTKPPGEVKESAEVQAPSYTAREWAEAEAKVVLADRKLPKLQTIERQLANLPVNLERRQHAEAAMNSAKEAERLFREAGEFLSDSDEEKLGGYTVADLDRKEADGRIQAALYLAYLTGPKSWAPGRAMLQELYNDITVSLSEADAFHEFARPTPYRMFNVQVDFKPIVERDVQYGVFTLKAPSVYLHAKVPPNFRFEDAGKIQPEDLINEGDVKNSFQNQLGREYEQRHPDQPSVRGNSVGRDLTVDLLRKADKRYARDAVRYPKQHWRIVEGLGDLVPIPEAWR
jgi:hypothetical protein